MDHWIWLLSILALLVGYLIGRKIQRRRDHSRRQERHLILDGDSQKYISGLNYLLNEEGHAAAEAFIDSLPVSRDTLPTHLSLGRMLRRNGEIASAIRTHQSLLASPYLDGSHIDTVQLELAVDYVSAGLFDRAETLLIELLRAYDPVVRQQALEHLVGLYRDEREWTKAIDTINRHAERRFGRASDDWALQQSHFSCELAQESIGAGRIQDASRQLRSALAFDKRSQRAQLLTVKLHILKGELGQGAKKLRKLIAHGCEHWGEMVPLLEAIYSGQGRPLALLAYMQELAVSANNEPLVALVYREMCQRGEQAQALQFLQELLQSQGPEAPVQALLTLLDSPQADLARLKPLVQERLHQLQDSYAAYTCSHCGYSSQQLYWLCPTCKSWGCGRPNRRPKIELGKQLLKQAK
ncbi:MAG: hypothetical protein OIF35_05855 [Cellvibrionaceae bacterium]|nr:hypothetical protein [Cellvibrionaceae bacterium]MCV6625346.1 hypothetical protein [Cellvibrionaceae bacterium]